MADLKTVDLGGSGFGLNVLAGDPVVLLTGALVGAINGFLVVRLRLNAFIVTLAMLILLRGMTLGITNGKTLFDLPARFFISAPASGSAFPCRSGSPRPLCLFGLFLRYHRLGRAFYAIGGNVEAARVAGIRVDRMLWGTFMSPACSPLSRA